MKINNTTPIVVPSSTNAPEPPKAKNNAPSFKGGARDFFSLSKKGPMTRPLFALNAFAFLLGTRLVTSRDKDEVRETFVRDVPTILVAVFGVPALAKALAKGIQSKSGIAIMDKEKSDVMSYDEIKDIYKFDEKKLSSGFEGFSERLSSLNGNLLKTYSSINEDIKKGLSGFAEDNKAFMDKLFDKSKESNHVLDQIKEALKDDKNIVLKNAMFKKTLTKMFGFGATIALAGLCIPKGNIALTNRLHRNDKKEADNKKA